METELSVKPAAVMRTLAILLVLATGAAEARAQNHQLGILIGGMSPGDITTVPSPESTVGRSSAFSYQFFYAHRMKNFKLASLHFEVPVVRTTTTSLEDALPQMPKDYSGFFVAPGLMFRILPGSPIVPYVSAGLGLAWFGSSDTLAGGGTNNGSTGALRGVADFGGGVDFKLAPLVGLRLDIRDFWSGKPDFNVETSGGNHNLLVSGGIVLRF
jgi:hypothetical protein